MAALTVAGTAGAYSEVAKHHDRLKNGSNARHEMLYLPSGKGIELISFGYRNALANVLWFNTVNYVGKHFKSDRNYQWLSHMCGLVTELNPKLLHVYEFCGLMLAWEAGLGKEAESILTKGITHHPEKWKLPYLRGMTYLLFLKDETKAYQDIVRSAGLPEAHPIIKTLAAKKLVELDSTSTAKSFLIEAINSSSSGWEKGILTERLKALQFDQDLTSLERAIQIYRDRHGSIPQTIEQLIEEGIVESIRQDPYGGSYYIKNGEVASTSGASRISLSKDNLETAEGKKHG